jgi:predicted secreted protein
MALAGHAAKITCADTDASGDEIDGIKNVEWSVNGEMLDTTDLMDTTTVHTRILGLRDLTVTLSGDYEASDTGQARLVTNFAAGTTTWMRWLPNGSAGFKASFKIQDYSISAAFDGTVEFSCTAVAITAPAAV